ncbi:armadillo-type protein [Schizophyllum commune]
MTKTYMMNSLIEKMQSPDQDYRFMGLNDLMNEIKNDPASFLGEEATENKVLKQVLALVEDKISEVKNQAVKCLGQLIKIIKQSQMELVVDRLIDFSAGKDDELRDIASLALKTITAELPPEGKIAHSATAKLAPKLLAQAANPATPPEALVETLAILSILIGRFPAHFVAPAGGAVGGGSGTTQVVVLDPPPLVVLAPLLAHPRPVVRKRAIGTLAQFAPLAPPELVNGLLEKAVVGGLGAPTPTIPQLVSALARTAPAAVATYVPKVVPAFLERLSTAAQTSDEASSEEEELREYILQALETLVLRCPTEVGAWVGGEGKTQPTILSAGTTWIKYDPNYAAGDDEDEEMGSASDEEDDASLDEYSDDEDTSYKVRRAAVKLLGAVISTRPEMLGVVWREVSPVLIQRFSEREETVRLEVWSTYVTLLNATAVYGTLAASVPSGKRKRGDDEEMPPAGPSPVDLLTEQVPALTKALLGQLRPPKTNATVLSAGFRVLGALLSVLPGSLAQQAPQVLSTATAVLSQPVAAGTAPLHVAVMGFLGLFVGTHAPGVWGGGLGKLTPVLLSRAKERHPRVAAEALKTLSALLNSSKPVKSAPWVDGLYDEVVARLSSADTDADVRARAEEVVGDLWVCAGEAVRGKGGKEWDAVCRTSGNTEGAVRVVTRVATEAEGLSDQWVNGCVQWALTLLRKSGRAGKIEIFGMLNALIRCYASVPPEVVRELIAQVKGFVSLSDIALLSQSLNLIASLLEVAPATAFPEVEKTVLGQVYNLAYSPLLAGSSLDAVLIFISALVSADKQISPHVIPGLAIAADKAPKGEVSAANVARCIAQVVQADLGVAAGTIAEYAKHVRKGGKAKTSTVVLSFLILGEIGRFVDMSPQVDIFQAAIAHFESEQEEVRAAAAFAAGNITVGNLHHFLPAIVKLVETDTKKRLLALHALKEVVTHSSHGQLESVADTLWVPLFEHSANSEEATRNVAAACLGKLAMTHPSRYLPQLHDRIKDANPSARATVVSAIRYTFADSARSYDELLAPLLVDFLTLMQDPDLTVRRLALSALNSSARTKPHLIREHLPKLLPQLYAETTIKPELIRTVQMGPWQHKVDDGLEARKTAYETLYTLLDTCLAVLDLREYLTHVIRGLDDNADEVKVICHMILFRLSQVAPAAVALRLDEATPALEKTVKGANVTKDTVKQDLERAAELQRSTLRAVVAMSKIAGSGVSPRFEAFVEELKKNAQFGNEFRD